MESKTFDRKKKENKPVLAICYDFDKTLSPDDMQAQGYIQSVGYDVKSFWEESNELAEQNDMDQNLAYMFKMVKEAVGNVIFNKANLEDYGSKVQLFPGVEDWFSRINQYGNDKGVLVEHYIISSGLKEMIEGTQIAKDNVFTKIYASSFYFNERGVAEWPAQVVNYTNKTQFLFRIEKGVLDINDDGVNEYFPPEEMRVPFRNMVYIGDSATDIPCMKLVNSYGGYSIGVFNPDTQDKTKVFNMINENRIRYFAPADYSEGKQLDILLKKIIDRTSKNEELENEYYSCKKQTNDYLESQGDDEKNNLIAQLLNSRSFAGTHTVIEEMNKIQKWNELQLAEIYRAATVNSQVKFIINDVDVRMFYNELLTKYDYRNENTDEITELLND